MKIFFKIMERILFDTETGAGGGGAGAEGTGSQETLEVPEYLSTYVSSIEDTEQKEYLEGLLKDEKGLNTLKGIIKDPNAAWQINKEEYKDLNPDEVDTFLEAAKNLGWNEEYTKTQLADRLTYLTSQREAMTPELRSLDENINNFISSIKDQEEQVVYGMMAENAVGRKILYEKIMNGGATPSAGGAGEAGTSGAYNHDTFIETYNRALDTKDTALMATLKTFAKNNTDKFYNDFLGI